MTDSLQMSVYEIVGSGLCVASDDGDRVFEQIRAALKADKKVVISFQNVESLTSAFLNSAIGRLYGEFPEELLRGSLSLNQIQPDDAVLLKRVVESAKLYFRDQTSFRKALQEASEGDDDQSAD